jgi:hypothetical protein
VVVARQVLFVSDCCGALDHMTELILIDQRSASLTASEQDVRVWSGGRRVFVSSLITDMPEERAAVRAAIGAVGATPVMFEDLGAQDISAEQAYLSGVRSSEIYVGMWGPRYGVRMPDGYSATHAEFSEAERHGLRLCLYVHGDQTGDMDGAQRDLISSARNLYTTSPWSDPADLERRVQRRLEELAGDDLAPWVRVGNAVFRATEIVNDGRSVTVTADIRSDAVHAELVRMRDGRGRILPFSAPNVAHGVQLSELSTRTVTTVGHQERIVLAIKDQQSSPMQQVSINGVPHTEVARRALSDGLFGTSTLGDVAFLAHPVDPFESLRGSGLDDSILRPLARLFFGERLLTEGIASRIESFALGPSHQGSRRLRATWIPAEAFMGGGSLDPTTIDGAVTGL